jgi:hypothetical protein
MGRTEGGMKKLSYLCCVVLYFPKGKSGQRRDVAPMKGFP